MEEEELLDIVDEDEDQAALEESSDYDVFSDSEDELFQRLKPVFMSWSDHITIREKELQEEKRQKMAEMQTKLRKEQSRKLTKEINDREEEEEQQETWKVRQLEKIKKDRKRNHCDDMSAKS